MLNRQPIFEGQKSSANLEAELFLARQKIIEERRAEWRGAGREFELHLFGAMKPIDEEFKKREEKILGAARAPKMRVTGRQARQLMDLVKEYQLHSPIHPGTDYARNLREAVAEALKLESEEEEKNLKFYTSAGGEIAVDVKLGTDAFFIYEEDGKKYEIRMDGTTNPDNPEKVVINADILIGPEHAPDQEKEPEEYVKEIKIMAQRIAEKILKKIERGESQTMEFVRREGSLVMAPRGTIREYIPEKKRQE
jgi:hypothetical protein